MKVNQSETPKRIHTYHFTTEVDPSILSDALSCCLGGMQLAPFYQHWKASRQVTLLSTIKDIQQQVEAQMERHYIYLVKKRKGHKILACFEREAQAKKYVEEREELVILEMEKMGV